MADGRQHHAGPGREALDIAADLVDVLVPARDPEAAPGLRVRDGAVIAQLGVGLGAARAHRVIVVVERRSPSRCRSCPRESIRSGLALVAERALPSPQGDEPSDQRDEEYLADSASSTVSACGSPTAGERSPKPSVVRATKLK